MKRLLWPWIAAALLGATASVARESTVPIAGSSVSVWDQGRGEPVVLVHALGLDRRMWDGVIRELAGSHRVIAYDVRGHGSARGSPAISMDLFARDLAELLDHLALPSAHIVGFSMGGVIAQTFALQRPHRVRSLTLIGTVSRPQAAFRERGASVERGGMPSQIVPSLTRWFTPAELAVNSEAVQYARASLLANQARDWRNSWEAMAGMDVHDRLPTLKMPTHVVAGELDLSCPPTLMYMDLAVPIPGASFEIIPGAPHMLPLSSPGAVAAAISRSVRRMAPA